MTFDCEIHQCRTARPSAIGRLRRAVLRERRFIAWDKSLTYPNRQNSGPTSEFRKKCATLMPCSSFIFSRNKWNECRFACTILANIQAEGLMPPAPFENVLRYLFQACALQGDCELSDRELLERFRV